MLSEAMARADPGPRPALRWTSRFMGARVDLEDKEAVRRALEGT